MRYTTSLGVLACTVGMMFGVGCGSLGGAVAERSSAAIPASADTDHPPIPIQFNLKESGYVTLVIEDANGVRVRNLISETQFLAGEHVVYWDGLDDLARDNNAASHAVYHVPGKLVTPGTYHVRGLFRKGIDLRYEFTVYNPGLPPWKTADTSSQWLTNHTPPSAICFIPAGQAPARGGSKETSPPQILVGSAVAEGGSGLAWLDLSGKKLHGQMWVGGVWTGVSQLARDSGPNAVAGIYAYTASAAQGGGYDGAKAELRLAELLGPGMAGSAPRDARMGTGDDRPLLSPSAPYTGVLPRGQDKVVAPPQDFRYAFPDNAHAAVSGLAVYNGLLGASLPKMNQILWVDAKARKIIGTAEVKDPRGLMFDAKGRLLVLSGKQLVRYVMGSSPLDLSTPAVVVDSGLEDPQHLAADSDGNIYISDQGKSHQVKVFTAEGQALRAIGTAGEPKAGPYDTTHMNTPAGITISSDGHLWVTENDYQPKRVSVWTLDGKLLNAFYGPPIYGGGGVLDPEDKSLFYLQGMTFKLDWKAGTGQVVAIHHRPAATDLKIPDSWDGGAPDTPLYVEGRKYFHNSFTTHPTNGAGAAYVWIERNGVAVPVAALGQPRSWKEVQGDEFKSKMPADARGVLFVWSDLNGDAHVQPDEVTFARGSTGSGVTVSADLSIVTGSAKRFAVQRFTPQGVPVYDLSKGETLVPDTQSPASSGGGQVLHAENGWTVLTVAPKPFAKESMGGALNGKAVWSYPSVWPGLHASHIAAMPEFPGELIGTTRLIGPMIKPHGSDAGQIWAINGNKGNMYMMTTDGLFVATLFRDCRIPEAAWDTKPKAERGMLLNDVTNGTESFWPSLTQTKDGDVYLITNWPSIIKVEGLESIRRIDLKTVTVTTETLVAAQDYFVRSETKRQQQDQTQDTLVVPIRKTAPTVDGKLDDWSGAKWVTVDIRTKQEGDWGSSKQATQVALAISGDRLYAAFKAGEANAIDNAATSTQNLFKTGGALDLMIATDPGADGKRRQAAAGDIRLLVAMMKNKQPIAVLYRPVVPGVPSENVQFGSPLRTIKFDQVTEVSKEVTLAQGTATTPAKDNKPASTGPSGDFEFSIPLSVLGLKPQAGTTIRGDVGVLRGTGFETVQRSYWTNKATGLTSDIPSEAELTPHLWGKWQFTGE